MKNLLEVFICDNCDDVAFVSENENGIEIAQCYCSGNLFRNGESK